MRSPSLQDQTVQRQMVEQRETIESQKNRSHLENCKAKCGYSLRKIRA